MTRRGSPRRVVSFRVERNLHSALDLYCGLWYYIQAERQIEYRGVEQLVARRAHNPEVVGSNPSPATRSVTVVDTISTTVIFYFSPSEE